MSYIIWLGEPAASNREHVGGKARNLALLAQAKFPVPPGFVVSSTAYTDFLHSAGIIDNIADMIDRIDFSQTDDVERTTSVIRKLIIEAPVPGHITDAIEEAYVNLGSQPYVAVRSSGTAEDLADASFAGMHDTLLDVRGSDELVKAVKLCWTSLWTARATSYRHVGSFDHMSAKLPLVVQIMVPADAAGVMYTANPITGATNEVVINSSWGLGESVVSGLVTPDECVLDERGERIKRREIGSKKAKIVRRMKTGIGTETLPVPDEDRDKQSIADGEARKLAEIGAQIMQLYGGIPQDIEWAIADSEIYILQSRNITAVDFSWSEDLDEWRDDPDDPNILWTLQWSNDFWNGACSPLHYSVRSYEQSCAHRYLRSNLGARDMVEMRVFKYWQGRVYYNTEIDAANAVMLVPPYLREGMLNNVHPDDRPAVLGAPFNKWRLARIVLRQLANPKSRPHSWMRLSYKYMVDGSSENVGLTTDELRELSDQKLKDHINSRIQRWIDFNNQMWLGFFTYGTWAMYSIDMMLSKWWPDLDALGRPSILQDLISGLPLPVNKQAEERQELWRLSEIIRKSPQLRKIFYEYKGATFFDQCRFTAEGQDFLVEYEQFVKDYGARGTADRDWYYARREEDPALDYNSFEALLNATETESPEQLEQKRREKREDVTKELLSKLRQQPFGGVKSRVFLYILNYTHQFLRLREDQRHYLDIIGQSKKRAWMEVGNRLVRRGVLHNIDDVLFLSWREAFELLDGEVETNTEGVLFRISNRRRVFDKVDRREISLPMYIKDQMAYSTAGHDYAELADENSVLQGAAMSSGRVTARARVVPNLTQLSSLRKGEILVCNSTDPGWATAFLVISGLVMEDGALLSHGACLSREYGLPAVTLQNAMKRIPDGALITVDGSTGEIIVDEIDGQPAKAAEAVG